MWLEFIDLGLGACAKEVGLPKQPTKSLRFNFGFSLFMSHIMVLSQFLHMQQCSSVSKHCNLFLSEDTEVSRR